MSYRKDLNDLEGELALARQKVVELEEQLTPEMKVTKIITS